MPSNNGLPSSSDSSSTQRWNGTTNAPGGNVIQGRLQANRDIVITASGSKASEQDEILKRLDYSGRRAREAQIANSSIEHETFEWVWKSPLAKWLQNSERIFWICGKPASGKSTLVNYICNAPSTRKILNRHEKYMIINFFFDFRQGNSIRNSFKGLLLSLLYYLVRKIDDLARRIKEITDDWQDVNSFAEWPEIELQRVLFHSIAPMSEIFYIFIDGIDEYDGDMFELVKFLKRFASSGNIRLCLSSRHEPTLDSAFSTLQVLELHQWNTAGLRNYILLSFGHIDIPQRDLHALSSSVIDRSEGVFLWARFAVAELRRLWSRGSRDIDYLLGKVQELPKDIEALWARIFGRLEETEKEEAAVIFQLVCYARNTTTAEELLVAIQLWAQPNAQLSVTIHALQEMICRVRNITGGLLEFTPSSRHPEKIEAAPFIMEVKLIHKTVRAYLERRGWKELSIKEEDFNPEELWLKICVRRIAQDRRWWIDQESKQAQQNGQIERYPFQEIRDIFPHKQQQVGAHLVSVLMSTQNSAIRHVFHWAGMLEQIRGVSSYQILKSIMCRKVIMLHLAASGLGCSWERVSERQRIDSERNPLSFAISRGLQLYFADAMREGVSCSKMATSGESYLQAALEFAQCLQYGSSSALQNHYDLLMINLELDSQLLETVLSHVSPQISESQLQHTISNATAKVLSRILGLIPREKFTLNLTEPIEPYQRKFGNTTTPVGLIWILVFEGFLSLKPKLDLLLSRGEDINSRWGRNQTAMHALFNRYRISEWGFDEVIDLPVLSTLEENGFPSDFSVCYQMLVSRGCNVVIDKRFFREVNEMRFFKSET